MLTLTKLYSVHDVVHTEKKWTFFFSSFFFTAVKRQVVNWNDFFIYNNDENVLDGYLIARETFHTDI